MAQYTARFHGRTKGAIGIFYGCTVKVEADSLEQAQVKLYDTHEPYAGVNWSGPEPYAVVNWSGLTNDEVVTKLREKGCDVAAWECLVEAVNALKDRRLTESETHAVYRAKWVRDNCFTADRDLINNNIGKGCAVIGIKPPALY